MSDRRMRRRRRLDTETNLTQGEEPRDDSGAGHELTTATGGCWQTVPVVTGGGAPKSKVARGRERVLEGDLSF